MILQTKSGFLDRTLKNLKHGWQNIAGSSYDASAASNRPDLPDADLDRIRQQMNECLEAKGGEVSARARAAALGHVYLALDSTGKERFLRLMAQEFDLNRDSIDGAIGEVRRAGNDKERVEAERNLRRTLEAPRVKLLTQFNALPEGVKFLVDMRADLLPLARKDPLLKGLEQDLKGLLASWFDVGFLELRRIGWQSSSAALLEKLIAYEAVHAIESWDDLKNRLDSDRRCFAYFHPRMPDEPLIFVEVALVKGMSANVQALLDEDAPVGNPEDADTAIFYSISNAQKGLAGISFGNFLIKRVVGQLTNELKSLKTFATLSPVPGFMNWLDKTLAEGQPGLLKPAERKAINQAAGKNGGSKGMLKSILSDPGWIEDEHLRNVMRGPLLRLCANYLLNEKGRGLHALDPVANFHLSNGAVMERLNWAGDCSENGLKQSAGIMINYLYDLDVIEENHEAYTGAGKITSSSGLKNNLKG
jgi:malonyl-CoA decarboxylase